jgi:hypothetical protein
MMTISIMENMKQKGDTQFNFGIMLDGIKETRQIFHRE